MKYFNIDQRQALSSFFNNLAVGWALAFLGVPAIDPSVSLLTLLRLLVNIFLALGISLYLLKD